MSLAALLLWAGVPHWLEWQHRPPGLTREQAVDLRHAQAAVNLGSHLWRAQERHFAERGDYVTESTRMDELGVALPWPEGLELGGLAPAPGAAPDGDGRPGWRLVFTNASSEHWCIHWTRDGLQPAGSHLPAWMAARLGLPD